MANIVPAEQQSGNLTNHGAVVVDNEITFSSDQIYLEFAQADKPSGFWTDSNNWIIDFVLTKSNDSMQTIICSGAGDWPVTYMTGGTLNVADTTGNNTIDISDIQIAERFVYTIEHTASGDLNYYVNGTKKRTINSSSIFDIRTYGVRIGAYGSDGRYLHTGLRCIRIRNSAPYQGSDFESDLMFLCSL